MCENNAEGLFVTVWLGIMEISTGKVRAVNAGHDYPAVRARSGNFSLRKDKHGIFVGAMPGVQFPEYEFEVEKGGALFLYTDGVPEATNAQEELFGLERMEEALNDPHAESMEQLLKNVRETTDRFVGNAPQFDDLTMLAVERK